MPTTTFVSQEEEPADADGSRGPSAPPVPACLRIGGGVLPHKRPPAQPNAVQRPKLSLETTSMKTFNPVSLGNARSTIANSRRASAAAGAASQANPSPIRTRDSVEQLTERGYCDVTNARAAAPWARPADFTPVGYDQAFTPASHRQEYFPSPGDTSPIANTTTQGLDACLEGITTEDQQMSDEEIRRASPVRVPVRGLERRPATKNRQKSAPARIVAPPTALNTGNQKMCVTAATPADTRRQTLPRLMTGHTNVSAGRDVAFTPVTYEVPTTPRRGAPETYDPKPGRSPTKSNRSRRGSIVAAKALSRGVGAVKTVISLGRRTSEVHIHHRNHSNGSDAGGNDDRAPSPPLRSGSKGSSSSLSRLGLGSKKPLYQKPMSLAEYALNQPQASRQAGDEFTNREIAELSPASCELLWRATSTDGRMSEEAREKARLSFTARQQVGLTPEARASAELTRRALERTPSTARSLPDRNRREETARSFVAFEKDSAEQMALRDPNRYPGLRRP